MNVEEIFGDKIECEFDFERKSNPIAQIFAYIKEKKCFPPVEYESQERRGKHTKVQRYIAYTFLPKHIRRHVKWCGECGIVKPRTIIYFARDENNKDNLSLQCRECLEGTEWYIDEIEIRMRRMNRNTIQGIYKSIEDGMAGREWEGRTKYSIYNLKRHLKSQFQPGMSFKNYGEWHIDHIKPKSKFRFSSYDDPQFQKCWALENLCPMWAKDNAQKHATYPYTIPESRRHLYPNPCPYTENAKPINPKSKEAS